MKKISKWLHRILSIVVGVFISIVCFTGAMLIFEDEITEWQTPKLYKVTPKPGGAMPISELLTGVLATENEGTEVLRVTINKNPKRSYRIVLETEDDSKVVYVNQYTGEVLGEPKESNFFDTMYRLHRSLLQPRPDDDSIFWGKKIVGISTLIFVFILITGIILWIPRKGQTFGGRLKISVTRGWRRLWYDLHVVGGAYVAVLLLLMALTGLTWAFPWYRTAFYNIFAPDTEQSASTPKGQNNEKPLYIDNETDSVNIGKYAAWQKAIDEVVAMNRDYAQLTVGSDEIRARISNYGNRSAADTYEFNPNTGTITGVALYADESQYRKARGWIYSLHTGYWGGFAMRVIYFIAALLGAALPITGYYLWIKRRFFNKKKTINKQQ